MIHFYTCKHFLNLNPNVELKKKSVSNCYSVHQEHKKKPPLAPKAVYAGNCHSVHQVHNSRPPCPTACDVCNILHILHMAMQHL